MTYVKMTWLVLCTCLLAVTEGRRREGGGWSGATPFSSAGKEEGLDAVVQKLVTQLTHMTDRHSREWSRLRRLERRGKSARHDIDIMHADIIQLRQHVIEINSRLNRLDDVTSGLQLKITQVGHDQQKLREEMGKAKHSRHAEDDEFVGLKKNVTRIDAWRTWAQGRLDRLHVWSQELQRTHHDAVTTLSNLQFRMPPPHTSRRPGSSTASPDHQAPEQDWQHHLPAASPMVPVLEDTEEGRSFQNRPQGDQSAGKTGQVLTTVASVVGVQYDVNMSGDGELEQDMGSGEGDEFFIIEERHSEQDNTKKMQEEEEDESDAKGVTPTPLTTSTIPTLTLPSLTLPTSPLPSCPSLSDFLLLQQRVEDLDSRLQTSMPVLDHLHDLANRTEQLEAAVTQRDHHIQRVQNDVGDLGDTVSRLTGQLGSVGLNQFMERLQGSLVNFSATVLTVDQWETVYQQMQNVTDRTQWRLSELGRRVTDSAQVTSDLHMTLEEQRAVSQRQYRTLQTHVIRLNNSLQDLTEQMDLLASRKPYSQRPSYHRHSSASDPQEGQQGALLTSRLDDLALQLVYNDNRLSHLETQVLNASLNSCRKTNSDLYQDASLLRMDKQLNQAQRDLVTLKDTVKRLDLGLYRLHGNSKATQEALRKVKGQVNDVAPVVGKVEAIRSEVDNLLFQMPVDCEDYYGRGYRQSGEFIIYPRGSPHSIKVHCFMQLNDHPHHDDDDDDDEDEDDDDDNPEWGRKEGEGGRRERRRERPWMEAGGWTVIHQRTTGKVNFTRSWAEYAVGFGTPHSEYWLGNEFLHLLTQHRNYTLLLTLTDIFGGHWHATYRPFAVSGKEDNYRLRLGPYHGNATDTLRYASGMTFSTFDRDTDVSSSPCARYNGGGWWYSHCQISNLNGPYDVGMIWFHKDWRDWLQLRQAAMMIRPFS